MDRYNVDAAILTYKPGKKFLRLLYMLERQSIKPGKIIVINTGEGSFIGDEAFNEKHPLCEVRHIDKGEFDHGKTRNLAASLSGADFLIFMTQDAVPRNYRLVEELLKPMENEKVAVSYGRQLPDEKAGDIERYNRGFNYPPEERLKTREDIKTLGIKTIFCSDVCACYRKSFFDGQGGFTENIAFNEDMIYAYHALMKDRGIFYAAKAEVIHSHEYTALQQFKRNFDLGASQADHPEVFSRFKSEGEGKRLVKGCISYLYDNNKAYLIPGFILHCAARYAGFLLGKNYRHLKKEMILKITSDRAYWIKHFGMKDKGML